MDPRAAQKAAKKKAQKAAQRQQAKEHEEEEAHAGIMVPPAQQPLSTEGPSPAVRVSRLVLDVDDEGEAADAPAHEEEALTHEKVASLDDLVGRPGRYCHAAVPASLVAAAARVVGFGSEAPARPTRVQAEVWARALHASPPDMVAVSATGSGKTLAFLLPALVEAAAAERAACGCGGDGPVTTRVLVLAPTRELALQTHKAALSLEPPDVRVTGLVGGVDFHTQRASLLSERPTLVVATVGRLLGHCGVTPASTRARQQTQEAEHPTDPGTPALALHAVTLWVLDEADRLLDLGFADDLHAVRRLLLERSSAIARPSQEDGAQRDHDAKLPRLWCMMFSATWSAATRTLAAAVLSRCDGGPLQIHVGESDLAGARTIEQRVELVQKGNGQSRFRRLCGLLREFGVACAVADDHHVNDVGDDIDASNADSDDRDTASDSDDEAEETSTSDLSADAAAAVRVLVFVVYKKEATHVANGLCDQGFAAEALQGDMSQRKRSTAMQRFRDGGVSVLVATDVAARGLDVTGVDAVINYSVGGCVETYVHRIGRCGRAGRRGVAHTLVTADDLPLLPALVEVLRRSRQAVPRELQDKATTVARQTFRKDGEGRTARVLTEEEQELREQQIANRAKQLAAQQTKLAKAHKDQRKSRHGRGRK